MESRPLITVYGAGAGTLTAGGRTVQLKSLDGWLTLDCDLQNAYKGTQNKNNTIFAPEFPVLPPGESAVTWTGGVTRVEIIPRWWTL
jgi:phage-related protein